MQLQKIILDNSNDFQSFFQNIKNGNEVLMKSFLDVVINNIYESEVYTKFQNNFKEMTGVDMKPFFNKIKNYRDVVTHKYKENAKNKILLKELFEKDLAFLQFVYDLNCLLQNQLILSNKKHT